MRTLATGLVLALSIARAAAADVPPASQSNVQAKPTPEQIAAAQKEGDALIFTANAQDVFDNETGRNGTATILLRHRASGFLCQFEPGELANSLTVYPNPHRGDDVGCNTMNRAGDRTTNFTRDTGSDDAWIAGAASAIQRHVPGVQPAPPPTDIRPLTTMFPGTPIPETVRYVTEKTFEEDVIGHVDGWMVEDRFTAPRGLATSNVLEAHWYATVVERMHHGAAPDAVAPSPHPGVLEYSAASAPSTPEEIAAARKEGDRMLVGDNAQALFDNITSTRVIALKNKASGLVCSFPLGGANSVTLGRAAATTDREDAINCETGEEDFRGTLTLVPNTTGATIDQALSDTVRATSGIYGHLSPYGGEGVNMVAGASLPKHRAIRLLNARSPPDYIYLSAAVVGGWTIVEQVVGPLADSTKVDLMGELKMVTAIGDLAKGAPH